MLHPLITRLGSLSITQIFSTTVIVIAIFFLFQRWNTSRRIRKLGGRSPEISSWLPFGLDFIYKYMAASANRQDVSFFADCLVAAADHKSLSQTNSECKTAELNSGFSDRFILTADPLNIKAMLSTQFSDYGKGPRFHDEWKEFIGDSIFGIDGELWEKTRSKLKPIFFKERHIDTSVFEIHVAKLIEQLVGQNEQANPVDILEYFLRYTFDTATDYLLGEATDCQQFPKLRIAEAFKYVLQRQSEFFRMDEFSWILSRRKFRKELQIVNEFIYPYVRRSLALTNSELQAKLSSRDNFLDSLAQYTRDADFLRDQLVTILLAGRDTTAGTLAFIFFELGRNPSVFAALRNEITEKLGEGDASEMPTAKDLQDLRLLNAVIQETLRVYPPVPINIRYAIKDTTLPTGGGKDGLQPIGVLEGTRIIFSTMLVHKDRSLYPDIQSKNFVDPDRWVPDRWLGIDGGKAWSPGLWEFLPFHHGKRACPGQRFAEVEIAYTVVRILQAVRDVELLGWAGPENKERVLRCRVEVTMNPDEVVRCIFKK